MIKHYPITKTDQAIKVYSEKDGVSVVYVCTTDFKISDVPVDVFYRATPHPKFGNKYFGLYFSRSDDSLMICDADGIEKLSFAMVVNDDGDLEYSRSHHDYKQFKNGNMIDGGRVYTRHSGNIEYYHIRNGKMVPLD